MAYKKEELIPLALEKIKEEGLYFIGDLADAMGIHKQTFYTHGLDEIDEIQEALREQKRALKKRLRKDWEVSANATLQALLYRLVADDIEIEQMSKQYVKSDNTNTTKYDLSNLSEAELEQIDKLTTKAINNSREK